MKKNVIPTRLSAALFDRRWSAVPGGMAVHCMVSLSGRLDEERLARAVRLTLDAEPILGCRFVERWFRSYWRRDNHLEDRTLCEVRASSDCQLDMRRFLEKLPDLPIRVLLLRGDSELLCVKLDHRVGDGKAVQEFTYLLAETYNRLAGNPGYRPVPNVKGNRSLTQVGERFGLRAKWLVFRDTVKTIRRIRRLGQWQYPVPRDGRLEFDYVAWRLDADQVNALFEYGCRRRASVTQVLLAAFYLAIAETLPHSTDLQLPVSIGIDLRRYLPATKASTLCNLVGNSVIGIDPRSGMSIDAVLEQIRVQMKAQQKYLGLAISFFALEALPVIRHLAALVPNGRVKRAKPAVSEGVRSTGHTPGMVLISHVGELDQDRLDFAGTTITDAFATGGVFKIPGLLGLGVSGFRGSLTLYLGCGPTTLVTGLRERIMQLLPARSRDFSNS